MKYSFLITLLMLAFCGCQNNRKSEQPFEAEIETNERVEAKMASVNANKVIPDEENSELESKKAYYYEKGRWSGGYDRTHATTEKLKEEFKHAANSQDPSDMGNKDLFNEYLRGYEEGQRQRNQDMTSGNLSSSELESKKAYYYEKGRWSGGYDRTHATTEKLKEEFKHAANSQDPSDMGNKDLFNEYLRGYEEGQRQRNQL